jgi:uncharacterized protein YkwD
MRVLVAAALTVLCGLSFGPPSALGHTPDARPATVAVSQQSAVAQAPYTLSKQRLRKQLEILNDIRRDRGLQPLIAQQCLTEEVAQPWARHLADIQRLVHRDLDRVFDLCPRFNSVGENIAYGYPTARAVMRAWMNSRGHRRNILRPGYTHVGLGLAQTPSGVLYWVQNFGG